MLRLGTQKSTICCKIPHLIIIYHIKIKYFVEISFYFNCTSRLAQVG